MTQEQKINILIRKYGSKSILRDASSSYLGEESSFSPPIVLTQQLYTDLQNIPYGKNPLVNSPVNLSEWSYLGNPAIRKIIRKQLVWIEGTNVFYDPTDSSDPSALVDIISPTQGITFSPEVFYLDSKSNRYLNRISPSKDPWTFDYETGCLVFLDGLPSVIKAPQFQPPAITCYRYIGRKNAKGIASGLVQGPTGPTGPTGVKGSTAVGSIVWKGDYSSTTNYSIDDAVNDSGVIYVKKTGVTGPTPLNLTYFDSITFNEENEGFISSFSEQYIDTMYGSLDRPYFYSFDELSTYISSSIDPKSEGYKLRKCDQNITVFLGSDDPYFQTNTPEPYSTRIFNTHPSRVEELGNFEMQTIGRSLFLIDGLYSNNSTISSNGTLEVSNTQLISPTLFGTCLNFYANSSTIPTFSKDVSSKFYSDFFRDCGIYMYGKTHVSSTTYHQCQVRIGDQIFNRQVIETLPFKDRVIHYFENVEFIDTDLILEYSGRYSDVELVFNRCSFVDSRVGNGTSGITFPIRPYEFSELNLLRYRISITFIDTAISCNSSEFNFPDYSDVILLGTTILPTNLAQVQDVVINTYGTSTTDSTLAQFLETQYTYSDLSPRACSSFYYNK